MLRRRGADPAVTDEMQRAIARIVQKSGGLCQAGAGMAAAADLNQAVRAVVDFLEPSGTLDENRVELSLEAGARPSSLAHAGERRRCPGGSCVRRWCRV
ncbi:MAG: hypothetical protein H0T44_04905 [Gemmatimonadales bacterium]|nr:hypothetical protein [Gemmatimonadales bacterium]